MSNKNIKWPGMIKNLVGGVDEHHGSITAIATIGLLLVAFGLNNITQQQVSLNEQQLKLTELIEKPKANIDFLCPKLDENGVGVTDIIFYNDGEMLGQFTIQVNSQDMLVSLPPFLYNVSENNTCIRSHDGKVNDILIGPRQEKNYSLIVRDLKTGGNPSFSIGMKCQSRLCISRLEDKHECKNDESINYSDQAILVRCEYPAANTNPKPILNTIIPGPREFCERYC